MDYKNNKKFLSHLQLEIFSKEIFKSYKCFFKLPLIFSLLTVALFFIDYHKRITEIIFLSLPAVFLLLRMSVIYIVKCHFQDKDATFLKTIDFTIRRIPHVLLCILCFVIFFLVGGLIIDGLESVFYLDDYYGIVVFCVFIFSLYAFFMWFFMNEYVIFFGTFPLKTFKESRRLMKGYRRKILSNIISVCIGNVLIFYLAMIPITIVGQIFEPIFFLFPIVAPLVGSYLLILSEISYAVMFLNVYDLSNEIRLHSAESEI